jgi:putative DNA modification/repair radical SAM protein
MFHKEDGAISTVLEKIRVLGQQGRYDICASTASTRSDNIRTALGKNTPEWVGNTISSGICHSYTPDGHCVSLFKVLYTNRCLFSCKYCFTQTCKKKLSFSPEEYAQTFMKLFSMNVTEGIFLTSGICGDADQTTQEMLNTVQLLRSRYKFDGYIHFKILPGTSYSLIRDALHVADRISVNVEAPSKGHLAEIADQKDYNNDILLRQRWIKELQYKHQDFLQDNKIKLQPTRLIPRRRKEWVDEWGEVRLSNGYQKIRWNSSPLLTAGQTTQFILGAAGESDWDVLKRLDWEYREIDLRRGYFSAFSPVSGTPFENKSPTPLDREHRLYQTDWLLRCYHFPLKEVKSILTDRDNLPHGDPKIFLARAHFAENGLVDVNTAPFDELIRVPGLGPLSAKRILDLRQNHQLIDSRRQLQHMGVVLKRADPFLVINGNHQQNIDVYIKNYGRGN